MHAGHAGPYACTYSTAYTYCMYTTKLCCLRTENRKKNKNVHHLVHSEESDLGVVVSTLPVLHQTPSLEMPLPPQFISPLFHPYNTVALSTVTVVAAHLLMNLLRNIMGAEGEEQLRSVSCINHY